MGCEANAGSVVKWAPLARASLWVCLSGLVVLASACAKRNVAVADAANGGGGASAEEEAPEGPTKGLQPVFSSIRSNIFEPKCGGCHFAGGEAQFLRFDWLAGLRMYPGLLTGDPQQSILIDRVVRSDEARMPPLSSGKPGLTGPEVAVLRRWIGLGAPE